MENDQAKQKKPFTQYIAAAINMLMAGAIGYFGGSYLILNMLNNGIAGLGFLVLVTAAIIIIFIGLYIGILLQTVIHEAGHLVFGLLTSYKFSSFRVGSLMWIKLDGKVRFKKMSVKGTSGQCLMIPPEMKGGKFPVILYNFGGCIANILAAALFLMLYYLFQNIIVLGIIFLVSSIVGFSFALLNGIPLRLTVINNDGYNALSLGKNPEAMRAFWIQLKVNELTCKDMRLKDMPQEWFVVPSDEEMKNSMCAAVGVFACGRFIDEHRFDEAIELIKRLLHMDSAIVGLHRNMLNCDLMFCELITGNQQEFLNLEADKNQKKFMSSMKQSLSVIRTEYAAALLAEEDNVKAAQLLENFERATSKNSYSSSVQSERELIELAQNKSNDIKMQSQNVLPEL